MYDIGYGVIDNGGKPLHYHFEPLFSQKKIYDQKKLFINAVEQTFQTYNSNRKFSFYYLLENPELGFSPKNCMIRPFAILPTECKLPYKSYISRSKEYREFIYSIINDYPNITLLDPQKLFCRNSFCYAIKDGKMLYADDDHLSVDGSILQAQYFAYQLLEG